MASRRSEAVWAEFVTQVSKARARLNCAEGDKYEPWFRGHRCSDYKLIPSLFRGFTDPDGKDWTEIFGKESDLFWEFAARARELHGVIEEDWDILFAMQHYGTPTRLLD